VSCLRVCGLGPVSGVLPSSWCGALDLGAQILGVVGFLIVALVLLWSEQAAGRGDAAPLNNSGAVGFLILQIKAEMKLFLAGGGGEGEKRSLAVCGAVLLLLTSRGGEDGWICGAAASASCSCSGPPLLGPIGVRWISGVHSCSGRLGGEQARASLASIGIKEGARASPWMSTLMLHT
jgi:hypothetical protein